MPKPDNLIQIDDGWAGPVLAALVERMKRRAAAEGRRFNLAVGYSTASAHGGTHDCDGVGDATGSERWRTYDDCLWTVNALREEGCAAWIRGDDGSDCHGGDMDRHIHFVVIGCPGLSYAAERQVAAYLAGFNGLGPSVDFRRCRDYHTREFVDRRFDGLPGSKPMATAAASAGGWTHRTAGFEPDDPLNVRTGPGRSYGVRTTVGLGARLRILAYRGDWLDIALEGGTRGWVHNRYVHKIGA